MTFKKIFHLEKQRQTIKAKGQVVPDPSRCLQCGICSYNCPMGIDVRRHAWLGQPLTHNYCLACGECVARCPRGVLKFVVTDLFTETDN